MGVQHHLAQVEVTIQTHAALLLVMHGYTHTYGVRGLGAGVWGYTEVGLLVLTAWVGPTIQIIHSSQIFDVRCQY